jgi:signal transduction histidine kinase
MVGLSEDITERKRAEDVLREADRRKNEFLALLAHELRGPLAPLGNAVELLRLAAESRPDLRRIQGMLARQVDHLSRLVDDLVDLARIFHGALAVRAEPLDMATVVERALELARPTIDSRRLALAVEVAPAPMPVHGDLVRLTQALANVLHNAAKYTPAGGRVTVAAAPQDGKALVTVSDTGIGIPAAKLEQIFEPFVQASATPDAAGGLGLGLTLVRRLVQLHGGAVTATSAGPGAGSRFVIELPLAYRIPSAAGAETDLGRRSAGHR